MSTSNKLAYLPKNSSRLWPSDKAMTYLLYAAMCIVMAVLTTHILSEPRTQSWRVAPYRTCETCKPGLETRVYHSFEPNRTDTHQYRDGQLIQITIEAGIPLHYLTKITDYTPGTYRSLRVKTDYNVPLLLLNYLLNSLILATVGYLVHRFVKPIKRARK